MSAASVICPANPGDELRELLERRNVAGARTSVLVVGDGINVQALRNDGWKDEYAWKSILNRVARHGGLSEKDCRRLPASTAAAWDIILRMRSQKKKESFATSNIKMSDRLARDLRRLENNRSQFPEYQRLMAKWLQNIISFNVDRRLALSTATSVFASREGWSGDGVMYRHDILVQDGCATRIWYPFGDTQDPKTFRLGRASHASLIRTLEDRRTYLMLNWAGEGGKLRPPDLVYAEMRQDLKSWYDIFFLAPLIFVGVSLSLDAWPIWWLLHQRARNFVPFSPGEIPPTIFLTTEGNCCPELTGNPSEIRTITFRSYDQLWETLLEACDA